jgi:hypothetical protein
MVTDDLNVNSGHEYANKYSKKAGESFRAPVWSGQPGRFCLVEQSWMVNGGDASAARG